MIRNAEFELKNAEYNTKCKHDKILQALLFAYVSKHGLYLSSNARFYPSIDCCLVYMYDKPVLVVGDLPRSVSNITETVYTRLLMVENEEDRRVWKAEKDERLNSAIRNYVIKNKLNLSEDARIEERITGVTVHMNDKPVLYMELVPDWQYDVKETAFTRQVMQSERRVG